MLGKTIDKGALYSSMDVRLLEAFRAVVDHRSVTAAAGAMGVTQPAVSTQIARLEEMIGFALFERSGGRLKPTSEGMLFYAEAMRVLGEFDRLQTTTVQIREGQAGTAHHRQPSVGRDLAAAEAGGGVPEPSGRACRCG